MSLTIAASPIGARVGFATGSLDGQQVVLTVAPKAWRANTHRHDVLTRDAGPHVAMTLFETDRLTVSDAESPVGNVLRRILSVAREGSDVGEMSWDSSLLVPDAPSRSAPTELDRNDRELDDACPTTDLLSLMERVELLGPSTDDLRANSIRSPLHRPLLYRRFLDEVSARAAAARRGYRTRERAVTAIRGRATARSLAEHAATGVPRLRCVYDELTESTLLLGVICAGLEWIADGRGVRSLFSGRFSERHLRHDAVALRRSMGEVESLSPTQARQVGAHLRLNRLDQAWAQALHMSREVLAESELSAAANGARLAAAVELSVATDKLWESIVTGALQRSGFDPVHVPLMQRPGLTEDPWKSRPSVVASSNTRPDNVAWLRRQIWIVDAKYKIAGDIPLSPSRDDQYQMFAYSHLVRDEPNDVCSAVLVYPGQGVTRSWVRGRDDREAPVSLLAVQLPFPGREDVRSAGAWESYLERTGERLGGELALKAPALGAEHSA